MNVNECILSKPERRIELKDISERSTLIERQKPIVFYNAKDISMTLHRMMLIKYLLKTFQKISIICYYIFEKYILLFD